MREVVNTIMRRATSEDSAPELAPYYEDLYDHVLRAAEWTESLRDMITSIFETNMSLSDTRMNVVMKKLTAWAAIIAVPTAVTGFYGQNVPYPGFGREWGVWASVAIIVVDRGRPIHQLQAARLAVTPRPTPSELSSLPRVPTTRSEDNVRWADGRARRGGAGQIARMLRLGSSPVNLTAAARRSAGTTP